MIFSRTSWGQDLHGFVMESPFLTSFEYDGLLSGKIEENLIVASHQFNRTKYSRTSVNYRFYEVVNHVDDVPNFQSIQFGVSHKHDLREQRSLGVLASYGSASDRPFKNARDNTVMVNMTYLYNPKWLWLVNYSNNRTFLNNVPLPGVAYIKEASREKSMIFGFPFIYIHRPIFGHNFSYKYFALLPYNHRFRLNYNHFSFFKPYVSYEQAPRVFFDSDRTDKSLRNFWFDRKVAIGIEKSFGPLLKLDIQFGRAFDREFFQAESFMRARKNVIRIDTENFLSFNLKSMF